MINNKHIEKGIEKPFLECRKLILQNNEINAVRIEYEEILENKRYGTEKPDQKYEAMALEALKKRWYPLKKNPTPELYNAPCTFRTTFEKCKKCPIFNKYPFMCNYQDLSQYSVHELGKVLITAAKDAEKTKIVAALADTWITFLENTRFRFKENIENVEQSLLINLRKYTLPKYYETPQKWFDADKRLELISNIAEEYLWFLNAHTYNKKNKQYIYIKKHTSKKYLK